jgi:hypothetical protein
MTEPCDSGSTRSKVDLHRSRHAVRFYAYEAELAEAVADHLAPGTEGGTSVVIATAGHLDLF